MSEVHRLETGPGEAAREYPLKESGEMDTAIEGLKQQLFERITALPEHRLQEVLDFVEFLRLREDPEEDPILRISGSLSGAPISTAEIDGELYRFEQYADELEQCNAVYAQLTGHGEP